MKLSLLESPSICSRDGASLVIFPSKPYWFSATAEIKEILEAFDQRIPEKIINKISANLEIPDHEASVIFEEIKELLYSSGVLRMNGQVAEMREHFPHTQISEVENVLVIATTQECNLECPMCYASAKRKMPREMSFEQIKAIVDQLKPMLWQSNISRVALTGGEIFTRIDAIELIDYVHSKGYFVQLNTNATLLTETHIDALAKFERLKVSISLDGSKAESHEFIRGKGTFYSTVRNIQALSNVGVSVGINMFVHAGNLDEIKETAVLASKLGADGFNCLNMMNVGRGNSIKTKKTLIGVSLSSFYRTVFEAVRYDPKLQKLMRNSTFANQLMGIAGGIKSHGCGIGTNRAVYIKPDGSLYPCADTALPTFRLGNLNKDELSEIWESSPLLKELRLLDVDTMNQQCASCDVRYMCGGNCRGENYQTTKDLRGPHFKCSEIRDSILELMWILTEEPDLFKVKVEELHESVINT